MEGLTWEERVTIMLYNAVMRQYGNMYTISIKYVFSWGKIYKID